MALYQLILTDEALVDFSRRLHRATAAARRADRDGLREAVKSGVVQAISSHHQPHERDAKLARWRHRAGHGGVGLLPLAMTLVEDGLLDLPTLLARLSTGPADALSLPAGRLSVGSAADLVLFDPGASPWPVKWHSKATTAHSWAIACQAPCATLVDGRISYEG